ncbi:hypothetical protein JCM12294_17580 [Desulfocicer niacini]
MIDRERKKVKADVLAEQRVYNITIIAKEKQQRIFPIFENRYGNDQPHHNGKNKVHVSQCVVDIFQPVFSFDNRLFICKSDNLESHPEVDIKNYGKYAREKYKYKVWIKGPQDVI